MAVDGNNDEAKERQNERNVDGRPAEDAAHVDDAGLNRGKHRASEDGHDESGRTEFGIVAQSLKGDTVDGREHQGHAG